MNRPVLSIPKTQTENIHTIVSIAALLLSFSYFAVKWADLPNTIPIHFNSSGDANGWGSRSILIILPLLALALFIGLSVLSKFPHKFNYFVQITEENARNQYTNGRLLVSWLKLEIVLLFGYIEWDIVQAALGNSNSLGFLFYVFIVIILATIVYFQFRIRK